MIGEVANKAEGQGLQMTGWFGRLNVPELDPEIDDDDDEGLPRTRETKLETSEAAI